MYYFIIKDINSEPHFLADMSTGKSWTRTDGQQSRFYTKSFAKKVSSRYSGSRVINAKEAHDIWDTIINK